MPSPTQQLRKKRSPPNSSRVMYAGGFENVIYIYKILREFLGPEKSQRLNDEDYLGGSVSLSLLLPLARTTTNAGGCRELRKKVNVRRRQQRSSGSPNLTFP